MIIAIFLPVGVHELALILNVLELHLGGGQSCASRFFGEEETLCLYNGNPLFHDFFSRVANDEVFDALVTAPEYLT